MLGAAIWLVSFCKKASRKQIEEEVEKKKKEKEKQQRRLHEQLRTETKVP